jgi:hypothetical protein
MLTAEDARNRPLFTAGVMQIVWAPADAVSQFTIPLMPAD